MTNLIALDSADTLSTEQVVRRTRKSAAKRINGEQFWSDHTAAVQAWHAAGNVQVPPYAATPKPFRTVTFTNQHGAIGKVKMPHTFRCPPASFWTGGELPAGVDAPVMDTRTDVERAIAYAEAAEANAQRWAVYAATCKPNKYSANTTQEIADRVRDVARQLRAECPTTQNEGGQLSLLVAETEVEPVDAVELPDVIEPNEVIEIAIASASVSEEQAEADCRTQLFHDTLDEMGATADDLADFFGAPRDLVAGHFDGTKPLSDWHVMDLERFKDSWAAVTTSRSLELACEATPDFDTSATQAEGNNLADVAPNASSYPAFVVRPSTANKLSDFLQTPVDSPVKRGYVWMQARGSAPAGSRDQTQCRSKSLSTKFRPLRLARSALQNTARFPLRTCPSMRSSPRLRQPRAALPALATRRAVTTWLVQCCVGTRRAGLSVSPLMVQSMGKASATHQTARIRPAPCLLSGQTRRPLLQLRLNGPRWMRAAPSFKPRWMLRTAPHTWQLVPSVVLTRRRKRHATFFGGIVGLRC